MDDPLWRCMDSTKTLSRAQLELVIQKKKIAEVHRWFEEHFITSSHKDYIEKTPILIIQGPTGCGKTSTLRWIADELRIPIKEFSETTDTTAITYNLTKSIKDDENENLSSSIDRRKAYKFENFVYDSVMYNALFPTREALNQADSEFESDDDIIPIMSGPPPPLRTKNIGVIIHIDTSLTFVKTQRTLVQTLCRLMKIIKDTARKSARRVAIVFESLEGDNETISLPTKVKLRLKIQVFKFNPIIKTNMKKLIESLMQNYNHITIDKETIEQIISDCDGDIRACLNTLQLICNRSHCSQPLNGIISNALYNCTNLGYLPASLGPTNYKRQKLHHDKVRQVKLHPSLMRDNTRSLGFFHVLGKIFYQKRIYPDTRNQAFLKPRQRAIDRPYPTENSTEHLANMIDVDPRNLTSWLHQHYHKFCHDSNIDKAALFLENISSVDTTSLSSTQSNQFYEAHHALDQLQIHLAIESTVYSLYEDQTNSNKPSHKKILCGKEYKFIKSSVENHSANAELYSFNKPVSMNLHKLVDDYSALLEHSTSILRESDSISVERDKVLLDYMPYIVQMVDNWNAMSPDKKSQFKDDMSHIITADDDSMFRMLCTIEKLEHKSEQDFEARHEALLEMIENMNVRQV